MQTDAGLCAAVARVMGKTSVIDRRVCSIRLHHDDPRSNVFGNTVVWAPDRPGKDFCEVLEWLCARYFVAMQINSDGTAWLDAREIATGRNGPIIRDAASLRQAVCRAVASMEQDNG